MAKQIDDTPHAMYERIQERKNHLTALCKLLDEYGEGKGQAFVDYKGARAKAILNLKTEGTPVTIVKDIADGRCKDALFKSEVADSAYKSLIVKIQAAIVILNATQSQNKYLDVG